MPQEGEDLSKQRGSAWLGKKMTSVEWLCDVCGGGEYGDAEVST